MNTQESNIMLLSDILDAYEAGILDMTQLARKCYLSEREKHLNRTTWIHNDELKNQSLLRGMAKKGQKDLLKQTREKL